MPGDAAAPMLSHHRRRLDTRVWALAASVAAVACNSIFGVDDLSYDAVGGQSAASGSSTSATTSTGGGSGGSTTTTSGSAGGGGAPSGPPSCLGLPATCGPNANESCCASPLVAGGSYNRSNQALFPATVSDFRLDRFEVTVGRFRQFFDAYPASKPVAGAGAHPLIPNSGWDPSWDMALPTSSMGLDAELQCGAYATWTSISDANETLPLSCVSWPLAFAFCAWDGGRLPTEAEWNYAAAGGNEQRIYPWGSDAVDAAHAVYGCTGDGSAAGDCTFADILAVGSRSPKGDGKSWGEGAHADLAGSMWEWTLDAAQFTQCCGAPYASPLCTDCADLGSSSSALHVLRGGCFTSSPAYLETSVRYSGSPGGPCLGLGGIRCARTP